MTNAITPIEKVLYTAKAHTTGGRDGGASLTSDGRLDVKLSVPGTPAHRHQPRARLSSILRWPAAASRAS